MDRRISDLLLHAYGSVLDARRWPGLLDRLVTALDGRGAVLVVQERGLPFEGFDAASRLYREELAGPFAHYREALAHHEAADWAKLTERAPGETYFDTELGLCVDELDARPHYRYAAEHFGTGRRIAFRLNHTRGWFDAVAVAYHRDLPVVPDAAAQTIAAVAPHLGRAVELTRAFNLLRQRYAAVLSALDRFSFGVAIALPSGEVIVANAEARRILEEADAIRQRPDGRLECAGTDEPARLFEAIAGASRTAAGEGHLLEAPLRLERRSGADPVLLDVAPLRDGGGEIEPGLSGAVVYLMDMARPPPFDVARFARLHGLTGAEAEVCALLIEGDGAPVIAEKRATSVHTARDQAKAVLLKTGCASRGQLFRLLAKTLPPVR